jgi:hypothetical protein
LDCTEGRGTDGYSPTLSPAAAEFVRDWPVVGAGEALFVVLRLDYLSCVLTVVSTILVGRKCWKGWVLAGINSGIICVIGYRTAQLGFIPANLLCIVMYGFNLRAWRRGAAS